MQMIDVLKRLAELDATNPNVVKEGVGKTIDPQRVDHVADEVLAANQKDQQYYFGPGEDTPEFRTAVADLLRDMGYDHIADEIDTQQGIDKSSDNGAKDFNDFANFYTNPNPNSWPSIEQALELITVQGQDPRVTAQNILKYVQNNPDELEYADDAVKDAVKGIEEILNQKKPTLGKFTQQQAPNQQPAPQPAAQPDTKLNDPDMELVQDYIKVSKRYGGYDQWDIDMMYNHVKNNPSYKAEIQRDLAFRKKQQPQAAQQPAQANSDLEIAKQYAKLMGYDPEDMDEIGPLVQIMKSNPSYRADIVRRVKTGDDKKVPFSESLAECGMMGGMSQPHSPASINMTADSGAELTGMLKDIMQLAGLKQVGADDLGHQHEPSVMTAVPGMSVAKKDGEMSDMKSIVSKIDSMNEPADEAYNNTPQEEVMGYDTVTPRGDDLSAPPVGAAKGRGLKNHPVATPIEKTEATYESLMADYRKFMAESEQGVEEGASSQELENSAYTMTLDQFVSVYGEENAHIWHKVNGEQGVEEGVRPIEINGKIVDTSSLRIAGVDPRDYPEFTDAYIEYGEFKDGTPMSDDELDQFSNEYSDIVNDLAYNSLHEGSGPKEKQHTPYGGPLNSPARKAAADAQREKMARAAAAKPGQALADKIAKKEDVAESQDILKLAGLR